MHWDFHQSRSMTLDGQIIKDCKKLLNAIQKLIQHWLQFYQHPQVHPPNFSSRLYEIEAFHRTQSHQSQQATSQVPQPWQKTQRMGIWTMDDHAGSYWLEHLQHLVTCAQTLLPKWPQLQMLLWWKKYFHLSSGMWSADHEWATTHQEYWLSVLLQLLLLWDAMLLLCHNTPILFLDHNLSSLLLMPCTEIFPLV